MNISGKTFYLVAHRSVLKDSKGETSAKLEVSSVGETFEEEDITAINMCTEN